MSQNADIRLVPVAQAPAYELAAEQMRRAILMGRYLPGEKFPPERELSLQLNVSRTTLREALRTLSSEGLVETTRGSHGGVSVLEPPTADAEVRRRLRNSAAQINEAMDLRIAIESHAARLAAERRTKADLKRIVQAFEAVVRTTAEDPEHRHVALYVRTDTEFHLAIARATRNGLLVRAVEDARARMFHELGSVFSTYSEHVNDHHEEVIQAIEAGEAERAEAAMRRHIETSRADVHDFARRPSGRGKPAARAKR
jgi:GntR family transcriptional repressor for pyruvate dehydrogenase complex